MNLNLTTATRYGLNVLALLGTSIALYLGSSIFIPVTISVLLATILYPAAVWFNLRLRFPWFFASLVSILGLVFLHLAIFTAVAASVPQLINKLPASEDQWMEKYSQTANRLRDISPLPIDGILPPDPDSSKFYLSVKQLFSAESLSLYLQKLAGFGAEQLSQVVLILFVTLFLLLEGEMLAKKGRAIFGPSTESQARVTRAIGEMAEAVRKYLVWRTIVNLGLAVVCGLVYKYAFKLDQWYLWAILTAVLNYVPYIGTIAAGVPPFAELLINGRPDAALGAMIFYGCVVTVEGYLIVPWVMGRSMDLNATTVMLACLFWHLLWGVAGLFLAMPLMAGLKAICMHVEDWNAWGQLMSSGAAVVPPPEGRLHDIAGQAGDGDQTILLEEVHRKPEAAKTVSP
jgi:predicted PurR-regulated permease PerM